MKAIKICFALFAVAGLLTACDSDVSKEISKDVSKEITNNTKDAVGGLVSQINDEVISEIRKKYPLPDPVVVNNAHNDVANITTTLTLDKVVEFYRKAYSDKGFAEIPGAASVSSDSAKLAFRKAGEKDIYIEATKNGNETKVRLEKK